MAEIDGRAVLRLNMFATELTKQDSVQDFAVRVLGIPVHITKRQSDAGYCYLRCPQTHVTKLLAKKTSRKYISDEGDIEIELSSANGDGKPHFLSQGGWLDAGTRLGDKAGIVDGKPSKKRVAMSQHAEGESSNKKKTPSQQAQQEDEQSWTKGGGYGYHGGKNGSRGKGYGFQTYPNRYVNQGQPVHGAVWYNQGKGKGSQEDRGNAQYRGGWNHVAAGSQDLPFHPLNQGGKGKGFRGGKGGF